MPGLTHLGEVFHSVRGTEEEKKAVENLYLRPSANYFNYYEKLVRGDPSLSVPTPEARQDTLRRYLDFLCLQWPNMFVTIDVKYDSTHHFESVWSRPHRIPALFEFLKADRVPILHIKRRDVFAKYCSLQLAEATGTWHITTAGANSSITFHLATENLVAELDAMLALQREFTAFLQEYEPSHELYYEDMFDEPGFSRHAGEVVGSLIGRDIALPAPSLHKTTPPLRQVILNWPDVFRALRDSPYEGLAQAHFGGKV